MRVPLFHDNSTVHIGWHQGGWLYVCGSLSQVQDLLPAIVHQEIDITCLGPGPTSGEELQRFCLTPFLGTVAPEPVDPAVNTDRQLDLRILYVALRVLCFGAWRMTDSSDHPRQSLLEAVASDIAIGHCDAALTMSLLTLFKAFRHLSMRNSLILLTH